MHIQNIPEIFFANPQEKPDLFVYDFKMTDDVFKTKVRLNLHMFSFLQKGRKEVHLADATVSVNDRQSLLIKKGNALWSEMLDNDDIYYCKLLFFSEEILRSFLIKQDFQKPSTKYSEGSFFVIENDQYIKSYLGSLTAVAHTENANFLMVKFEELMLYLLSIYGQAFEIYLNSLISTQTSRLQVVVENNVYSNLKIEELAFLCHMSLSSFKRNFIKVYQCAPGKWLHDKRLNKAKELLEKGSLRPSDIFSDFGYNNLSNFSIAFKNKFGKSPKSLGVKNDPFS